MMNRFNFHITLQSIVCRLKPFASLLFFLFVYITSFGQKSYLPPVNGEETMKTITDERFENNNYSWPVGDNDDGRFSFFKEQNGSIYSIYNPNENRSIVGMNKGVPLKGNTDFTIVIDFDLWKTLSEGSGNCGGGFVWAPEGPFRNMQLLYFSFNQAIYKFAQWNEKGEYKLVFERGLPAKNRNISLEIQRKSDFLHYYLKNKDSALLLFTTPITPTLQFNKMGFYLDGKIHMTARRLHVKQSFTAEEKFISLQNRAEDFTAWEKKAETQTKELAGLTKKKNIDYKDKIKIKKIQDEISTAYKEMGNIKWIDNDIEAALTFYSLALESGNEAAGRYAGRLCELKYRKTQEEQDKEHALSFYFRTAKLERTDLGFPPALKSYYSLKYPFITDYSFISPFWQNEYMIPKTKEEYERSLSAWTAYKIQSKALSEKLAKRPLIVVKSVVINNYSPDSTQSYITTSNANYQRIILKKIPFNELRYGDCYYNQAEKDFIPFITTYDKGVKDKGFAFAIRYEDFNMDFSYLDKPGCSSCFGEGFVKTSSGAYTYKVATGRYNETRNGTIVGQTESITRTPIYETHTVQAGPPKYELCKVCNGTGGIKREKIIQIIVDGIKVK